MTASTCHFQSPSMSIIDPLLDIKHIVLFLKHFHVVSGTFGSLKSEISVRVSSLQQPETMQSILDAHSFCNKILPLIQDFLSTRRLLQKEFWHPPDNLYI